MKSFTLYNCNSKILKSSFILICLLFLANSFVLAQNKIESTNEFIVNGLVEKPLIVTFADLEKETAVDLGNIKIINHLGELKREYTKVKGVSLLTFLNKVNIITANPKLLSEYYLVFKASDGYSAVVSWNEIFNTEIGNSFYLIISANNKSMKENKEGILLMAVKDFRTGRRHIKNLKSIEIKRI